jgi:regulation of enolase protein 1 (concanavalin A-like superfamily)
MTDRPQAALGIFDGHGDVGQPRIAGTADYDPVAHEYTLTAGGVNMWGQRDEFHFVWTRLTGDFVVLAAVEFVGAGVEPHRKAGVMVRPSLEDDAPYVDAALHGDGLTALQYRRVSGGASDHVVAAMRGADTIRFQRRGDHYLFGASKGKGPVVTSEFAGVALGSTVYVGLFLCSHNPAVRETATVRDVRILR